MKTCNDCIHCEACISQVPRTFWDSETFYDGCKYFKDKSGFIELPCKVGDTVYELEENGRIAKGTVQSIHQNLVGNEQGRWIVTSWFDYYADSKKAGFECGSTFDDFGKTVFLTREEAEKALKERER